MTAPQGGKGGGAEPGGWAGVSRRPRRTWVVAIASKDSSLNSRKGHPCVCLRWLGAQYLRARASADKNGPNRSPLPPLAHAGESQRRGPPWGSAVIPLRAPAVAGGARNVRSPTAESYPQKPGYCYRKNVREPENRWG